MLFSSDGQSSRFMRIPNLLTLVPLFHEPKSGPLADKPPLFPSFTEMVFKNQTKIFFVQSRRLVHQSFRESPSVIDPFGCLAQAQETLKAVIPSVCASVPVAKAAPVFWL